MTTKRKFYRKGYQHICQISADKGLIFYTDADFIVFFTIVSVVAVKYKARIIAFDIMYNHFHIEASFASAEVMELFANEICSIFAKNYNGRYYRSGQLFKKSFNSAPKWREPDIEDNYVYVNNNAMPKHAVQTVSQYRWNFLAYMVSNHPFSEPIDKLAISFEMKRTIKAIDGVYNTNKYLNYKILDICFEKLTEKERLQAIDYIIVKYNIIDYGVALKKWGTYERILEMLSIVKGTEYDMSEDLSEEDYKHYDAMKSKVTLLGFPLEKNRFDSDGIDTQLLKEIKFSLLKAGYPVMEVDKFMHQGAYARRVGPKGAHPAGVYPQGRG